MISFLNVLISWVELDVLFITNFPSISENLAWIIIYFTGSHLWPCWHSYYIEYIEVVYIVNKNIYSLTRTSIIYNYNYKLKLETIAWSFNIYICPRLQKSVREPGVTTLTSRPGQKIWRITFIVLKFLEEVYSNIFSRHTVIYIHWSYLNYAPPKERGPTLKCRQTLVNGFTCQPTFTFYIL